MDKKSTLALIVLGIIGYSGIVSAAYTPAYTIADLPDIMVDFVANATLEAKGSTPDIIDMLMVALLFAVIGIAIGYALSAIFRPGKEISRAMPKKYRA